MAARILIIEDNPTNLELMSYLLEAFGYQIATACDGEEGLQAAQRDWPDLIICDVEIPKINGVDVARRLKGDAGLRWIPLLAVTAFAMVGDRDRVLAAGFDGYISKPINPERFVREVEAFLPIIERSAPTVSSQTAIKVEKPRATHATLLVVDNSPVNIELLRSILEPSGYYVFSAANVDDGLELARQTTFDLIISDLHMPDSDGYAFIQAVKADPAMCAIPFMFLSSTRGGQYDTERDFAFGADRFIVRPIEPKALLGEIEALLRGRESG